MKSWQRFLSALMAGFLIACLVGGIPFQGHLVSAAEPPVEPAATSPEPAPATGDTLEVEGVSTGDTLPVPAEEQPDGTLRVPEELRSPFPDAASEAESAPEDAAAAEVTSESLLAGMEPEEAARAQLLMQADQLYLAGDTQAAEPLYRQAKDPEWNAELDLPIQVEPITDPAALPPAAAVYWREAQAGREAGLPRRTRVPLELLVKEYPEFLPGQALYVDYLLQQNQAEEARQVVESAIARYPFNPDLIKVQTQVLMHQEKWLEAAITARQFTLFNPDHPENEAMLQLSQDNSNRFRSALNERLTGNLIGNIITGAAGYILTGGLLGPFTAINSSVILLQGESGIGAQVANRAVEQLPVTKDAAVVSYVDAIGQKLAALTGRDEFDYDFHVVLDDTLNAFALPGGKVFIHAGAIMKTDSEAELAGLLGHEISHAALSHGFQLVTQGNLTTSLAAFIPIPEVAGLTANLIVSSYSREMERQADVLGTQILAAGDYAADGLHNLRITLREENSGRTGLPWLASHPAPNDRVGYLKQLVEQGGFNRFAYEGVEPHLKIRQQVSKLMADYEREKPRNERRR
ncbi:MAG: M48 family metalloprotease [Cyanobacteria bacterium Co-bin13]|nr:M48 family metalloprotease [Cyanobacteria bacterium Co-bin13]